MQIDTAITRELAMSEQENIDSAISVFNEVKTQMEELCGQLDAFTDPKERLVVHLLMAVARTTASQSVTIAHLQERITSLEASLEGRE
jgi:hypothetical protein